MPGKSIFQNGLPVFNDAFSSFVMDIFRAGPFFP
jgi:hypothetical protein